MTTFCKCKRFKKEAKLGLSITYNSHYRSYYIYDVETDICDQHKISNIRINFCPWCGKKLKKKD